MSFEGKGLFSSNLFSTISGLIRRKLVGFGLGFFFVVGLVWLLRLLVQAINHPVPSPSSSWFYCFSSRRDEEQLRTPPPPPPPPPDSWRGGVGWVFLLLGFVCLFYLDSHGVWGGLIKLGLVLYLGSTRRNVSADRAEQRQCSPSPSSLPFTNTKLDKLIKTKGGKKKPKPNQNTNLKPVNNEARRFVLAKNEAKRLRVWAKIKPRS